jgi:hypothetical protein
MSEMKSYIGPHPTDHTLTEYYLKSEADKVISELKADYKEACDRLQTANLIKDEQLAATRHSNYKWCTAMAEWCEATALWCYQAANTLPTGFHATLYGKRVMIEPDRLFKRHVLLTKWSARWRELAEKFKPYKEADDGND